MVSGICCFNIESNCLKDVSNQLENKLKSRKVQVGSTTFSFFSQTDRLWDKVLKMSACIPVARGTGFGLDVVFW